MLTTNALKCDICGDTGWVSYEFPTSDDGGKTFVMRQRINRCHHCHKLWMLENLQSAMDEYGC